VLVNSYRVCGVFEAETIVGGSAEGVGSME
jgi:hypothetical protein